MSWFTSIFSNRKTKTSFITRALRRARNTGESYAEAKAALLREADPEWQDSQEKRIKKAEMRFLDDTKPDFEKLP